jgi:glycosyltransferase involved in cell wall biosynthesis
MRIVFVNPVGAIGGAERALLTILAAVRTARPNLQLHLIVGTDGPLIGAAQNLGVQVKLLKLPDQLNQLGDSALKGNFQSPKEIQGNTKTDSYRKRTTNGRLALLSTIFRVTKILPSLARYLGEFRRTIREIDPDLIHSNGIKTHLLTALAGSMNVPVVWHIHDFYGSRPLMARALRWMSHSAAIGIAISEAVAEDARATLPRLPIEVVYNSVDVNYFSPEVAVRADLADLPVEKQRSKQNPPLPRSNTPSDTLVSPNDTIRVGLVATYARWKGHDVFLEAAARIVRDREAASPREHREAASPKEHRPNVRFYIIGSPIYQTQGSQFSEQELRELTSVLQIADNVEFIGFQENIAEVYRWLDIVVHASTQPEPFGLAIIEAMACAKPTIVSQAGGAAELFTHNYDAVGVQPGDRAALASAIQHLIDNPALRKSLSENARSTVLKRFSHERLGEQILAAYKQFKPFD